MNNSHLTNVLYGDFFAAYSIQLQNAFFLQPVDINVVFCASIVMDAQL